MPVIIVRLFIYLDLLSEAQLSAFDKCFDKSLTFTISSGVSCLLFPTDINLSNSTNSSTVPFTGVDLERGALALANTLDCRGASKEERRVIIQCWRKKGDSRWKEREGRREWGGGGEIMRKLCV